jgi:hypothetical protein
MSRDGLVYGGKPRFCRLAGRPGHPRQGVFVWGRAVISAAAADLNLASRPPGL